MHEKQDVPGIIRSIIRQRARQRSITIGRRELTVESTTDYDYRVNRHEVFIAQSFVLSGDPLPALDAILGAIDKFDRAEHEDRVRKINEVKSSVLRWTRYLERTLTWEEYEGFIASLAPPPKTNGITLDIAEGVHYIERGIHYDP